MASGKTGQRHKTPFKRVMELWDWTLWATEIGGPAKYGRARKR